MHLDFFKRANKIPVTFDIQNILSAFSWIGRITQERVLTYLRNARSRKSLWIRIVPIILRVNDSP